MKTETCFLETHFLETGFRFQKKEKKKHVSIWTKAGNRNALRFRFQEKNRLQFPYGMSVVKSANEDSAKTKRVKIPVAELRG